MIRNSSIEPYFSRQTMSWKISVLKVAKTFSITKITAEQEYGDLKTDYDPRMWIDEVYLFNL